MAPKRSAPHAPVTRSQNKRLAKEWSGANSILNYFSNDSAPTTETENGQVVIYEKDSDGPDDAEGEEDPEEADISGTNTIEEEEHEESARMARTEQIQIMLDEMGLPSDIFGPEAHTNWLGILLDVSMASDETKEAILDFSKRIQNMVFPESMIDVVQWHQDKDRQSWHTHCAKMIPIRQPAKNPD
ncbi:hypothetical protein THAR02_03344 [Trichoderma harzianum]|uniref:Uncharacterized protein n=1 Tax=Trichoderma harzianum TaxID=5544 RepID=A0A0G0AI11_TRIHA|nr:hypothetical protein THAR02_03344 [Trichoderma harzianum]